LGLQATDVTGSVQIVVLGDDSIAIPFLGSIAQEFPDETQKGSMALMKAQIAEKRFTEYK
jgi:hypothetical protein